MSNPTPDCGHILKMLEEKPEPKISVVQRKPRQCPTCKGKVVEVLYGEPTEEAMQLADEKQLFIGGCSIVMGANPQWGCVACGLQFLKKLTV